MPDITLRLHQSRYDQLAAAAKARGETLPGYLNGLIMDGEHLRDRPTAKLSAAVTVTNLSAYRVAK